MALRSSLFNNNKTVQILTPAVRNTTVLSAAVDMQDYSDLMVLAHVGASGDTWSGSNYYEFEFQESDDNVTYTAVADANVSNPVAARTATGTFLALTANAQGSSDYVAAYRGGKRYVKVNVRATGTLSTGSPIGVSAVQGISRAQPVNAG